MNETDPLILSSDASTVSIGGVLMQEKTGIEKPIIFISHILSDTLGNYGIETVCFRVLRQATHPLPHKETIYSEDGPQESGLSLKFVDSKVGLLEYYFWSSDF